MSDTLDAGLEIECHVMKILSEYLPARRGEIGVESRLVEDLCVDSISLVEIVMALNEVFGIELPEVGVEGWRTVKDVCSFVRRSNFEMA